MKNLTFEVHTYAPELNKIFIAGLDVTKHFEHLKTRLARDYKYNVKLVRDSVKRYTELKRYKLVATRPDGSKETRFCNVFGSIDALAQLRKAKQYYNIEGTILDFKILY